MSKLHNDFEQLPSSDAIDYLELHWSGKENDATVIERLENIPGKHASVRIYHALSRLNQGKIGAQEAKEGIRLYGDYIDDEKREPNSHPNIRKLIEIVENSGHMQVVVYKKR